MEAEKNILETTSFFRLNLNFSKAFIDKTTALILIYCQFSTWSKLSQRDFVSARICPHTNPHLAPGSCSTEVPEKRKTVRQRNLPGQICFVFVCGTSENLCLSAHSQSRSGLSIHLRWIVYPNCCKRARLCGMGGNLIDALLLFASESPQTLAAQGLAGAASFLPSQMVRAFITDSKAKRVSVNPLQTPALVRVFITDLTTLRQRAAYSVSKSFRHMLNKHLAHTVQRRERFCIAQTDSELLAELRQDCLQLAVTDPDRLRLSCAAE